MEEKNIKILLNKERSVDSVNENANIEFSIENTNKLIPLNNINVTVSEYEQFVKERAESNIYRFYGVINAVIGNPVYNDNIEIFTASTGNIVSRKIMSNEIFENNGWIGYFSELTEEPQLFNDNESALCNFVPFDPGYDRLNVLDHDGVPNYMMKITYPAFSSNTITLINNPGGGAGSTIGDGIPIIQQLTINLNGRNYVGFKTLINHGLKENDSIKLYNFIDNTGGDLGLNATNLDGTPRLFNIYKVGDQLNDNKFRVFVVDINPTDIAYTYGATIKRWVNGKESQYYVRQFKELTSGYQDYDIYPASFGVNYFDDKIAAFNYIADVDITGLKDNLGRPLTELYLTLVKNDNDGHTSSINTKYWKDKQIAAGFPQDFWGKQWGGYLTELPIVEPTAQNPIEDIDINYNVRAISDSNYTNNQWFYGLDPSLIPNAPPIPRAFTDVGIDETDTIFDGDIVEYNSFELLERTLEKVYYRINTTYRENLQAIYAADPEYTASTQSMENKYEGYIYQPFKKIVIKEFSSVMNPIVDLQSVFNTYKISGSTQQQSVKDAYKIPSYATQLSPNVYKWRSLLNIGEMDSTGTGVDYPFESGAHYIYINPNFYIERQDPPCEYFFTSEDLLIPSCSYDYELQTQTPYDPNCNNLNCAVYCSGYFSDKDVMREMITRPTFFDYTIELDGDTLGGLPSFNGSLLDYNDAALPLPVDIRFINFEGNYDLGPRDTPGACIDFSMLKTKDIDDVC